MKLPHMKSPCKDCPFRSDCLKGWLGGERVEEILNQEGFTCHKTDKSQQCAGHMMLSENNGFVALAKRMGIALKITGKELLFSSQDECINHHEG